MIRRFARIRAIFQEGEGTYGADRICGALRRRGHAASFAKVKRLMNEEELRSVHLRHRRFLTDSRKARGDGYPNLLHGLEITTPFLALSSDISHITTTEGLDYLCTIRDVKSGGVLAEHMSGRMNRELGGVDDVLQVSGGDPPDRLHGKRGGRVPPDAEKVYQDQDDLPDGRRAEEVGVPSDL